MIDRSEVIEISKKFLAYLVQYLTPIRGAKFSFRLNNGIGVIFQNSYNTSIHLRWNGYTFREQHFSVSEQKSCPDFRARS